MIPIAMFIVVVVIVVVPTDISFGALQLDLGYNELNVIDSKRAVGSHGNDLVGELHCLRDIAPLDVSA
jgi:hypothetical protein